MRAGKIEAGAMLAVMAAAIAGGLALRLHGLMAQPFWLDEAYSAYAADHGFRFLWEVVPRYETHPPLYYSLVRLWSLAFGETLAARRWLGLSCGLAAIAVTGIAGVALGRLVGWDAPRRRWAGVIALTLAALQPQMMLMARQVRPYPAMTLVYGCAIVCLLRLAENARDGRRLSRRWLCALTLAETLLLWLHTLGPLFAASVAVALALLVVRRDLTCRDGIALAATQAVAGLLYLPALLIALRQAPTWVATTWLVFRPTRLRFDLGLLYASWGVVALVAATVMVTGVALLARRRWGMRAAGALLLLAALPTLTSLLLTLTVSPVYIPRTLSPVTVPALLLTAAGLSWPGTGRLLALPVAALLAYSYGAGAWALARRGPPQDWYGALRWLLPRMRPGDTIWAYPNEGALPLGYALTDVRRTATVVPIPAAVPAFGHGGYYVTGSQGVVSLYPREIDRLMTSPAARTAPTIWVLRLGPWKYDPGNRLIHALARTRTVAGHYRRGPIDFTGMRLSSRPAAPAGAAAAR